MILKKIVIKDQKELYRHKNYLLGLDLEFNSTKKEYSNSSEISFDNLFEITEFLRNHNFSYTMVEEKITDFKKQILAKYKTIQVDSNNIFIVEKNSENKIYLLNQIKNNINIVDLKNSNNAPKITAKGKGETANNIIKIAQDNKIPIKKDEDLVELLSKIDIDKEIPTSMYKAVAEIFAFIYELSNKR